MPLNPLTSLAAVRGAIGASAWAMPITAGRLFGMDVSADVGAGLFLRLGGTRDFALAAAPLLSAPDTVGSMICLAAACDLADIAAALIAKREQKLSGVSAALFVGASVGCLVLDVRAFQAPR